jgi:hypothetical protein
MLGILIVIIGASIVVQTIPWIRKDRFGHRVPTLLLVYVAMLEGAMLVPLFADDSNGILTTCFGGLLVLTAMAIIKMNPVIPLYLVTSLEKFSDRTIKYFPSLSSLVFGGIFMVTFVEQSNQRLSLLVFLLELALSAFLVGIYLCRARRAWTRVDRG